MVNQTTEKNDNVSWFYDTSILVGLFYTKVSLTIMGRIIFGTKMYQRIILNRKTINFQKQIDLIHWCIW